MRSFLLAAVAVSVSCRPANSGSLVGPYNECIVRTAPSDSSSSPTTTATLTGAAESGPDAGGGTAVVATGGTASNGAPGGAGIIAKSGTPTASGPPAVQGTGFIGVEGVTTTDTNAIGVHAVANANGQFGVKATAGTTSSVAIYGSTSGSGIAIEGQAFGSSGVGGAFTSSGTGDAVEIVASAGTGHALELFGNSTKPAVHFNSQSPSTPAAGDVWVDSSSGAFFFQAPINPNAFTLGMVQPIAVTGGVGFKNSWTDGASPVRYWLDASGMVHMDGTATKSPIDTTVIFTLPSGFRPAYARALPAIFVPGSVPPDTIDLNIGTSGDVSCPSLIASPGVVVIFDGINFATN